MSVESVLFLGAGHQQLPVIHSARRRGYRIVTSDNRPDNPGHDLADSSYDVSTTDFEGTLDVATRERVDGVVCFATDVAAVTAARVCEELGLPGNPSTGVATLTDKALFRRFQHENGFFAPRTAEIGEGDESPSIDFDSPYVIKPVDASGSRGVSRVLTSVEVPHAVADALDNSRARRCVVEELVASVGYQACGDGFLEDGRIVFLALGNEHFSPLTKVPVGESFPADLDPSLEEAAKAVLQAMFTSLGMRAGAFNVDLLFTPSGEVFVVEIGPRSGGNRIPEAILHSTGVDLVSATVEAALGRRVEFPQVVAQRPHATYSLHAHRAGAFLGISYATEVQTRIVDEQLFIRPGDVVQPFDRGSAMIGALILAFDRYEEMLEMLDTMDQRVEVVLEAER